MIKTENLVFEYNGQYEHNVKAVDNVSIEIKKGEFVAILGHNGSGKSTLAKHMNALLLPTKGTVYINNMDSSNEENIWEIRQSTGMVFQNPDNQLVATIVEEDVAFGPENLGISPPEIRRSVDEALKTVEMLEYAKHAPHLLSGGQKQRIAIAGIIAMKPKCIVFDEPTAMLDPSGRKEVMETIERLNKVEGITVLLITHFMDEAVKADRIYVMHEGKVQLSGKPKEVFKEVDMLKEMGLEVPQVTELCSRLIKKGINIPSDILTIEEMVVELCRLK